MQGIPLLCGNKTWVYLHVCKFHTDFRDFVRTTILNAAPAPSAMALSMPFCSLVSLTDRIPLLQDSFLKAQSSHAHPSHL